jgi:abortive infection bacteriophage resistance protein
MDKPFRTYDELVAMLRDEKNLSVPDTDHVISLLKKHSYFSLVSGYKLLFKRADKTYIDGTTIDDILALFEFDDHLRRIFFYEIQDIEKHIKSLLSYAFVERYGDRQEAYLSECNYNFIGGSDQETYRRCADVKRLIKTFNTIVHPPYDHKYIEHQHKQHDNIPLWATIKATTLGTTSKMYSLCTQEVQVAVSKEFPHVTEHQLIGMLDFLTRVRNVCAHNERLYDFESRTRAIQAMPLHDQLGIGKKKSYYKKGQRDLFAAVVCFKYLLPEDEFAKFVRETDAEIQTLCQRTNKIPKNKILRCMGFPENWTESVNF